MKIKPIKEYETNYQPVVKNKSKSLKRAAVLLSASMLAATSAGCSVGVDGMIANDTPEPTAYKTQGDGDNTVYTMGEISLDTPVPIIEPDEPVELDGDVKIEEP